MSRLSLACVGRNAYERSRDPYAWRAPYLNCDMLPQISSRRKLERMMAQSSVYQGMCGGFWKRQSLASLATSTTTLAHGHSFRFKRHLFTAPLYVPDSFNHPYGATTLHKIIARLFGKTLNYLFKNTCINKLHGWLCWIVTRLLLRGCAHPSD